MLLEKLNSLASTEIHNLYNKYWQECGASDEECKIHIAVYIIQFYRFRHMSENCKEKCHNLINDLKGDNKNDRNN